MVDDTDKTQKCRKMATEGQNTQPIYKLDGDMPKNQPVEEQQEKMDRNEENDEVQIDGASNNSFSIPQTQDDNVMVEEVVTTKTVHNPTLDTLEKGLEATEFNNDDAKLQCKAMNETVAKVKKPCACGSLMHSRQSHHDSFNLLALRT